MAAKIAAGPLPVWVRFSVRQGSKRQTVHYQAIVLAVVGLFLAVANGVSLVATGSASVWEWLGLCVGLGCALAGLWSWLAIHWVDRNGKWVQLTGNDAAAGPPRG